MKLSQGLWQTYKEVPADAEIPSHQLMIRAGLIHKSGAGLYNYMPFLVKSIKKVENIVREELDKVGCQELQMTVVTPGELWQESGRWKDFGDLMLKFKDKAGKDLCISPTNEEAIVDIFRKYIKSYKQLPLTLYQINTKFRDEIRPRFGLMRGREFIMKDAYSFHINKASLDEVYDKLYQSYSKIFNRIGLEFVAVEADAGAMADSSCKTHEFQVIAETGEDVIIFTEDGSYAANLEKASTKRENIEFNFTSSKIEEVATPDKQSIEDVCNYLGYPQHQSLKAMVYSNGIEGNSRELVLILLLGDDSLNEVKLAGFLASKDLRPAHEDELKEIKLPKGYIGPINLASNVKVIVDKAINLDAAYIVGASKQDLHLKNFIPSRDIKVPFEVSDLRDAKPGDLAISNGQPVKIKRGIEVGHIFQLGEKYTRSMNTTVLDQNGKSIFPLMGCYGIGVSRIIAAAIEQNHDDKGIVWPKEIAPYQIYFAIIAKTDELLAIGDDIYNELLKNGFDTLYDDRKVGPGFKFKDADLLGLPIQVILGEKSYFPNHHLEIIVRKTGKKELVLRGDLIRTLREIFSNL